MQAERFYRGRTVLIATTDHGRGEMPLDAWQHHGSSQAAKANGTTGQYADGVDGSDQIWLAAIGPGIAARGVISTPAERRQSQTAATLLQAIGLSATDFSRDADAPLAEVFEATAAGR